MKRIFLISLITLSMAGQVLAYDIMPENPEALQDMQSNFFQSPLAIPDVKVETTDDDKPLKTTPIFKKMRIRATRKYHKLENKADEKIQQFQDTHFKPKNKDGVEDNPDSMIFEKKQDDSNNEINIKVNQPVMQDEGAGNPGKSLELEGGVKELVVEKDMMLDCDLVQYYDDREEIEAVGNPVIVFPAQEVSIKADKMVYNVTTNVLKAIGNVQITKQGKLITGDYIQINMNEENAFMDNVKTKAAYLTVHAKKAVAMDDLVVLEDGSMNAEDHYLLKLETRMYGPRLSEMIITDEDRSFFSEEVGEPDFNVKAEEIYVTAKKEHDTVTLKHPTVYYKDKRLFSLPSFTAHTDKDQSYFQANFPELGSMTRLGMFAGPGFVFDVPFIGSTIKAIPFLNYKDKIGIGGALRYRAANNITDFAYGSAEDIFTLRGRQELDDNLYVQYGMNSYLDDWFLGMRMPKYSIEAIYDKKKTYNDFLGEGRDMRFRHRIGAGFMKDNDINRNNEKFASTDESTARVKYMAEIDQSLYRYEDIEKLRVFDVGYTLQGSVAMYGTGDNQFIGRVGPRIRTQYKYWMQDIGYFLSGYSDGTPMPRFDAYRYGHSNVYIREALRLNKWWTIAWSGSMNVSGDAPNDKAFQENAFIVAFGPDDFKVSLGYDFVREMTYFMVCVAMDVKGSSITYDKMVIKNPERIGKSNSEDESEFKTAPDKPQQKVNRVYAEIIDIEDPDKEKI